MSRLRLCIQRASETAGMPADRTLRRWANLAWEVLEQTRDGEIHLRIVDAEEMQTLNRQYRNRDYATNVLSFPAELPPELQLPLLGDIALCAPVVMREATEQNKVPRAHWAHLLIHGILHLLGHDHQDDREAAAMERLETQVLARLDFPPPYE